jgi:hypothetical protein
MVNPFTGDKPQGCTPSLGAITIMAWCSNGIDVVRPVAAPGFIASVRQSAANFHFIQISGSGVPVYHVQDVSDRSVAVHALGLPIRHGSIRDLREGSCFIRCFQSARTRQVWNL